MVRLGDAYATCGKFEAALSCFDRAVMLAPRSAKIHCGRGTRLQFLGDFEGAAAAFDRALELDPDWIEARFNLIQIGKWPADEHAEIARLESRLKATDLEPRYRSAHLFVLARLHERREDCDAAFACYAAANETTKKQWRFPRAETAAFVVESIRGFALQTFINLRGAGHDSERPVFVVGLPRSGTTLVESIIASHPAAFAGGEIRKLAQLARDLTAASTADLRYPRDAGRIAPGQLSRVGGLYLSHLDVVAPQDAIRVSDKLPTNFLHLGLIATLFPNARIINCRRDPMDLCLSCYFQMFNEPGAIAASNDLADLGYQYRLYERIMRHWHSVLPMPILDVDYEEVVRDQEMTSRRILAFVGLDWHDSCLDFHDARRGVNTASAWQVRQPIYSTSVGKWRRYDKHLGPLKAALADTA